MLRALMTLLTILASQAPVFLIDLLMIWSELSLPTSRGLMQMIVVTSTILFYSVRT